MSVLRELYCPVDRPEDKHIFVCYGYSPVKVHVMENFQMSKKTFLFTKILLLYLFNYFHY